MLDQFLLSKSNFKHLWLCFNFLLLTGTLSDTLAFDWLQNVSPLAYYCNFSNLYLASLQITNPANINENLTLDNSYYLISLGGENGHLHRAFDPQSRVDQSYTAGGSKYFGQGNLFKGSFSYHRRTLYDKMWVHNSNPYAVLPFLLADSSVGNFQLNGLYWEVTYIREWIPEKIYSGTTLFYNVDEEYKTVFPKPQINHRDIMLTQGLRFQINNQLELGLTALYFDFQENMETSRYNQDQTKTPIFYKIRGFDNPLVFKGESSEERLMATQGYQLKSDGQILISSRCQFNWLGGLEKAQCQNTDGGAYPVAQGKWNSHSEFFNTDLTLKINPAFSIALFAEGNRRSVSARHPSINIHIYSSRLQQLAIGINPYFTNRLFTFGTKYYYISQTNKQTDNYNGILHYNPAGVHCFELDLSDNGRGKFGAELNCGYDRLIVGNCEYYIERTDWFYERITQTDAAYLACPKDQIWSQLQISLTSKHSRKYTICIKYGLLNSADFLSTTAQRSFLTVRLLVTNY